MLPWSDPSLSTVFFRDTVADSLVQRHQLYGSCYMQGPGVVLHYALCKSTGRGNHNMINLTSFMLRFMATDAIWEYIYENTGGFSADPLEKLAGPGVVVETEKVSTPEHIVSMFKAHGPVLLSRVVVDRDLLDSGISRHVGPVAHLPAKPNRHAMAIVGWRHEEDGTTVFLVQNWWDTKQFFECDVVNLKARGARVSWIATPVMALPEDYPQYSAFAA